MPLILHRVDARPIALARIFIGMAYLVCLLEVAVMLSAVAGGKLAYPIFDVLPAVSPGLVTWIVTGGLIAGVLLILGVLSQVSAALAFAVLVLAQLLDQQVYSNHLV